jgi:hypothetical protein
LQNRKGLVTCCKNKIFNLVGLQKSSNQNQYTMKKILFIAAFLPAALIAQNITNTLGANGAYFVDGNANVDTMIYINPTNASVIFGRQPGQFTSSLLPLTGIQPGSNEFNFTSQNEFTVVSISNFATSGAPELYFTNASGSYSTPLDAGVSNTLGGIYFGGRHNGNNSWDLTSAAIYVTTDAATGAIGIPTTINFFTKNTTTSSTSTLNGSGTFTTPGAVVSQAIRQDGAANIFATYNDHTILVDPTSNPQVFLPSADASNPGKVYIIKRLPGVGSVTIIGGSSDIDGASSVALPLAYDYVVVQSSGAAGEWYIIGGSI